MITLAYFWWIPMLALIAGVLAFYGVLALIMWVIDLHQRPTSGRIGPRRPRFG